MTMAYVITESELDREILQKILPENLVDNTNFVAGAGRYSAQSLASTILAIKSLPVALIIDADTEDELAVKEQSALLDGLLYHSSPGIPFSVFLAVPELEAIFLQDRSLIETIINRELSYIEWQFAKSNPKDFLKSLNIGSNAQSIQIILNNLNPVQIHILQQHPLIARLINFLSSLSPTLSSL